MHLFDRSNPLHLLQGLVLILLVAVAGADDVTGSLTYDVPGVVDVVVVGVLSTNGKSDDVVIANERWDHVKFATHVDGTEQHLCTVVVALWESKDLIENPIVIHVDGSLQVQHTSCYTRKDMPKYSRLQAS